MQHNGWAALARPNKRNRDKQIEEMRTSLVEGFVSPQEVLADTSLPTEDKISLLLTRDVITDTGYNLLSLNVVKSIRRDFCEKPHDFGLYINSTLKMALDKIEAYANEELAGRDLHQFLTKNQITMFADDDVTPADIAATCISLYHFVAGESAANDFAIFDEPEVDTQVYVNAMSDHTMAIILNDLRLTYQQMLH
jgi:hypothetical protein